MCSDVVHQSSSNWYSPDVSPRQYYQSLRLAKLDVSSHRVRVGRVLNVLVCAGVVYCVFWVHKVLLFGVQRLTPVLFIGGDASQALFIVSTFGALKYPATDVVIDIIPQISVSFFMFSIR